ncbi:MAG TPA: DUF692 family protein, partial [Acidimicrobiales bacterium]|nr:DUF692 family protein [Acidimicrobiales bacterium]
MDPAGFARHRLGRSPGASLIAGLDAAGVAETAGLLERKAAKAAAGGTPPVEAASGRPGAAGAPSARARGAPAAAALTRAAAAPTGGGAPALGCGYRPALVAPLFDRLGSVGVWEHIGDWYLRDGARRLASFARRVPITVHCLALSVGSEGGSMHDEYVDLVRGLVGATGVDEVSDHLAFARVGSSTLPHFLPLW